jgi:hypothetical protein
MCPVALNHLSLGIAAWHYPDWHYPDQWCAADQVSGPSVTGKLSETRPPT